LQTLQQRDNTLIEGAIEYDLAGGADSLTDPEDKKPEEAPKPPETAPKPEPKK
jgi:hypothetical protein